MTHRHWDPDHTHVGTALRNYKQWVLEVALRQHTLGSFVIYCLRPGIRSLSELSNQELVELKWVMWDIEQTLMNAPGFGPDDITYLPSGYRLSSLQIHGIPRYEAIRRFGGLVWKDENAYAMPVLTTDWTPRELVMEVHAALEPCLPR